MVRRAVNRCMGVILASLVLCGLQAVPAQADVCVPLSEGTSVTVAGQRVPVPGHGLDFCVSDNPDDYVPPEYLDPNNYSASLEKTGGSTLCTTSCRYTLFIVYPNAEASTICMLGVGTNCILTVDIQSSTF